MSEESVGPLHIKTAIHEKFYLWARDLVRNKAVLDVGCGDGRGSAILAELAQSVTGVDIDSKAIELASQNNSLDNVNYEVMDCSSLSIDSRSVDVVICNALLEYLPDPETFFGEARRVLTDGGRIVCGTKNLVRSLKNRDGGPLYRNHLQEYTVEGLMEVMSKEFKNFDTYGETMRPKAESHIMNSRALGIERFLVALNIKRFFPVAIRRQIRRLVTGVDLANIRPDDFDISPQPIDDALYIICVGSSR